MSDLTLLSHLLNIQTANYSTTPSDDLVLANGDITITVHSANNQEGHSLHIKNIGTGNVNVVTSNSELIDANTSVELTENKSLSIVSIDSKWIVLPLSGGGGGLSNTDADTLDGQHGSYYTNASNMNAGTLGAARLSGTYANVTANDSTYAFGKSEANLNVNSALSANTSNTANTALTANNATYAFGKSEGDLNVNSALSANQANSASFASNADMLDGQHGTYYTNASNMDSGTLPNNRISGLYTGFSGIATPEYIQFNTAPANTTSIVGRLLWNPTDLTLDVGLNTNTTLQIGQETLIKVVNKSGALIGDGNAVYVMSAVGLRPSINLVLANAHSTATTLGIVTGDIANNAEGFVTVRGLVRGINTTGGAEAWANGDPLYTSKTTPGALTNIQPVAPHHQDKIGIVVRADVAGQGTILVNIHPHNMLLGPEHGDIDGPPSANNQVPVWNTAESFFTFKIPPEALNANTANNATYAFGKSEGNLNVNSALTANNATYAFGKTEGALNVNSALSANVANNATYAFGKAEGDLNVNSALNANNASYLGTKAEGSLNVNSALTANNATYAFGKSEGSLNVNSALSSNTANSASYLGSKTEGQLNVNNALTANSASYLGSKTEGQLNVNSAVTANTANTANNATYAFGKSEGDLNVNSALTANNATYAFGKAEANLNVNSALTANVANNATYAFGKSEANLNVNSALSANVANTANDASYLGGQGPAFYTNASNANTGTLPDARLSANVVRYETAQTQSYVLAAPAGANGNITFRALTGNDVFNLDERFTDVNFYGFSVEGDGECNISFDEGTYTFTLANTSAGAWHFMVGGVLYKATGSRTATLPGSPPANGTYYIYIDGTTGANANLVVNAIAWTLSDTDAKVPVAAVLWNNSNTPKWFLGDERHTASLSRPLHRYLHTTQGAKYVSGAGLSGQTYSSTVNSSLTFAVANAVLMDETLTHQIIGVADGDGATNNYTVFYHANSTAWTWAPSEVPFPYAAASYIQYDNGSGLTTGNTGEFLTSYVALSSFDEGPGGNTGIWIFPGRGEYATQALAEAENPALFDWAGLAVAEMVIIWQCIWATNAGYGTKGKVQLRNIRRVQVSVSTSSSGTVVTDHNTLTGLQGGTVGEYFHITAAQWSNGSLTANVANTANNATYAYGKTEGNLNVNSALTANNSTYAFGKSEGDLNVNSALSANQANSATYPAGLVAAKGDLIIGNATPAWTKLAAGANGYVLTINDNVITWNAVSANGVSTHDLLQSDVHTDTSNGTVTRGDIISAQGATPKWTRLAIGNSGLVLTSNGTEVYWGSANVNANDANYLGGKTEAQLNVNSALTANSATYLGSKTEGDLNVNSALSANNSAYLNGHTEAQLNVNSAVSANTSNNADFLDGFHDYQLNVNSALTANNATYAFGQTQGALNVNSALSANTANNATYAFGKTEGSLNVNSALVANTANLANDSTYAFGKSEANLNVNSALTANIANSANAATFLAGNTVQTNSTVLFIGGNVTVNTSAFFVGNTTVNAYLTSTTLTLNQATINSSVYTGQANTALTANNATYAFGKSEANLNVNSALSANTTNNADFLDGEHGSYYSRSANTTVNGWIDTGTQSFAGAKTFLNTLTVNDSISSTPTDNIKIAFGSTNTFSFGSYDVANYGMTFGANVVHLSGRGGIKFLVTGREAVAIDASGNVGIGLAGAAAEYLLHVKDSTVAEICIERTGWSAKYKFASGFSATGDFALHDITDNKTRLYFDTNGNTGIGTTTVPAKMTVNGTIAANTSVSVDGNVSINSSAYFVGNSTINAYLTSTTLTLNQATINSSVYTGQANTALTANNTTYAFGKSEGDLNVNSALTANIANTANSAEYANNANSAANANNAQYLAGKAESALNVNSALYANSASYATDANTVDGFHAADLNVNSATYALTANNSDHVYGKHENELNVNSALTANNSTYAYGKSEANLDVSSALTANVANNATYAFGKSEGNLNVNSALVANNSTYAFGKSEGDLNVNSALSANVANNATYAYGQAQGDLNVNSALSANVANNATYAFGKSEANLNVNNALTSNTANYASYAGWLTNAAGVALGDLIVGDDIGAGNNWTILTAGSNNQILTVNSIGRLQWKDPDAGAGHALLSATHSDANATAVTRGGIITGQGASPLWTLLALGANGSALTSNGTEVVWSASVNSALSANVANNSTYAFGKSEGNLNVNSALNANVANSSTYPAGLIAASGDLIVGNATPAWSKLAAGANGKVLTSNGSVLSWETPAAGSLPETNTGSLLIGNTSNGWNQLAIGANTYVLTSNGTTASWQAPSGGPASPTLYNAGNSGASKTLDWDNGSQQYLNLTANCTLTLSNPDDGGRYLILVNSGSGNFLIVWPANCKWGPGGVPLNTQLPGKVDLFTAVYANTTNAYYMSYALNY